MSLARLLLVLLVAIHGALASGAAPSEAAFAPPTALIAPAAAEQSESQLQVVETAFNLLMDRYVHPLDSAALLSAGWEQLRRDAADRQVAQAALEAPAMLALEAAEADYTAAVARGEFSNAWVDAMLRDQGLEY